MIVEVQSHNSKRCYVITEGDGFGEQILPFPLTGKETVQDAVANVNGSVGCGREQGQNLGLAAGPESGSPWPSSSG